MSFRTWLKSFLKHRHKWMQGSAKFHNLAKWDGRAACRWCVTCGKTQMRYSKKRNPNDPNEMYPRDQGIMWWETKTDSYKGMQILQSK